MSDKWEERTIKNPNHYDLFGENTIHILARSMTVEMWKGFCLGQVLKYRIRAGKKGELKQCIKKAEQFEKLFDEHKSKCIDFNA